MVQMRCVKGSTCGGKIGRLLLERDFRCPGTLGILDNCYIFLRSVLQCASKVVSYQSHMKLFKMMTSFLETCKKRDSIIHLVLSNFIAKVSK